MSMSIVEYRSTPSHKYYMNKSKDDIILRINMMRSQLKICLLDETVLRKDSKYNLASEAMRTHKMFPIEKE